MQNEDIRINGNAKLDGGRYEDIIVSGNAKFMGDVVCHKAYVSGMARFEGSLECDKLDVSGNIKCEGDVKSKVISITGVFKGEQGMIYADKIEINGMMKSEATIHASKVDVIGGIKANTLQSEEVYISLEGIVNGLLSRSLSLNKVENIECTKIEASYLKCKMIHANEITLTKNSKVDVVNCDGILTVDASCQIMQINGDCQIRRI
ncbi:cytoskeletal protein CcmA (bactofilin family) [Breznakia sp. PF5-3]|nr:cytoskeletal protein CcmA (bactofilin family) [Breznakia sp. PM6-1]MDF9835564.1 cytoskeletal protein CcmA (bactofilin family) [Breznakia sp. PF5-3]